MTPTQPPKRGFLAGLRASFLTGLFGINLGGIPGAESPTAFWVFCGSLVALATGLAVWLKYRRWW